MNKITKYCLHVLGWNLIILFLPGVSSVLYHDGLEWLAVSFIVYIVALFIQLFVGVILALGPSRDWGKAMLLSVGVIFLIGLSICTVISR